MNSGEDSGLCWLCGGALTPTQWRCPRFCTGVGTVTSICVACRPTWTVVYQLLPPLAHDVRVGCTLCNATNVTSWIDWRWRARDLGSEEGTEPGYDSLPRPEQERTSYAFCARCWRQHVEPVRTTARELRKHMALTA